MSEETRTPAEWEQITGITITDPDGWDRRNFAEDWATPITKQDFLYKMSLSTVYSLHKEGIDW